MGVPLFEAQKHHVGIGPKFAADDSFVDGAPHMYGFLLNPGYLRRGQNIPPPQDYGGERDFLTAPTLSRWTMDDFSGGMGQYVWGDGDKAMVARHFNMIPVIGQKSIRTLPPNVSWWNEDIGGRIPKGGFAYERNLYAVGNDRVRKVNIDSGLRTDYPGSNLGENYLTAWCVDTEEAILYLGSDNGQAAGTRFILERRRLPDFGAPGQPGLNFPTDITDAQSNGEGRIGGLHMGHGVLLVVFGGHLWTVKPPKLGAQVVNADWARIGKLPGPFIAAVSYNGLTYILCAGAAVRRTQVLAFDGTTLLPVTDFPYNFNGRSIATYGGRVYVGGTGLDYNDATRYAELYEITGSSLRLVKSFLSESRMPGVPKPRSFETLHVHEGLLWMWERGVGLIAYDVTTDSFYGASQMNDGGDIQRECYAMASTGEVFYQYIHHHLNNAADGWRRIATASDTLSLGYQGYVHTADFQPQPDRHKRWGEIVIRSRFGGVDLGYTIEGKLEQNDFTGIDASEVIQEGDYYTSRFPLQSIRPSKSIRFQLRFQRGVDVVNWMDLLGFTVSFQFLDSGKWSWQFTINSTERMEGPNGETVVQDIHDIGTELRRYWRERIPLRFRDLDGDTYDVQLIDLQESLPVVGPSTGFTDPETSEYTEAQEALYTISLIEV